MTPRMSQILFVTLSIYLNAFMQTYRPGSFPKPTHISKPSAPPIHTHSYTHMPVQNPGPALVCWLPRCTLPPFFQAMDWEGLVCLCVHLSVCLSVYWCIQCIECAGKPVYMCANVKLCIKGYSCVCLRVIILLACVCACRRHRLQMGLMHVGG